MARFLILFFVFLFGIKSAFAAYLPNYLNHGFHYGKGAAAVKGDIAVYEKNDINSKVLANIKITKDTAEIKIEGLKNISDESVFLALTEDIALLSVEDDTDEWFYICYEQKRGLFGWIRKNDDIDFLSWDGLFNLYGRKYGVYIFRNLPEPKKKLYSAPNLDSTIVDSFYFPKHIALWLVGGDWMLIKITTYDGQTKTGWFKWRLDDGSITAFPDFKNAQ